MQTNNNIVGYTLNGQPIYGQMPNLQAAPIQSAPRLTAPMPNQMTTNMENNGMIFVDGIMEAKSFRLAPGETVPLWDSNAGEHKIYVKSMDANGVPQKMRILRYEDITDEEDNPVNNKALTKDDINKLIDERFDVMFDRKIKDRNKNRKNQNYGKQGGELNE